MQSIKEITSVPMRSPFRGSERTQEDVRRQIAERWGQALADQFDARFDCMPLLSWMAYGFRVKKGEKALRSVTYVEVRDGLGEVVRKIPRTVNLFHRCQVKPQ